MESSKITKLIKKKEMDLKEAYKWGKLFNLEKEKRAAGMAKRANALKLIQKEENDILIWNNETLEKCRWIFVKDPSDIEAIRSVYANDDNIKSPACYIVVTQPDPSDDRGDIIFDIFRLNPQSYLWHFNRVFTQPKEK